MPGMLVRVPYVYKATVRRPRKRNDDDVGYSGVLDLLVAGVDPDDAPVVVHGVPEAYRHLPPHRYHDGKLWKPETADRDGKGPAHASSWLHGDPEAHVSSHPLFGKSPNYIEHRMGSAVPRDSDVNVKEFVSDDEAQVVAGIRSRAQQFLLVGDEVWRQTPEPVFDISRHMFGDDYVSLAPFTGERDQYRLDQGEWISEVDWSRSGRESALTRPTVVLLRPDLLRARATEHSVAWTCKHMVTSLFEKMGEGSVADFEVYARLRDATRALGKALENDAPVDLRALADLLSEALDTDARLDTSGNRVDYDGKYVENSLARIERELAMPSHDDVAGFSP